MASARVDDDKSSSFRMSDSAGNGMMLKLGRSVEKSCGENGEFVSHAKPKQGPLMRKLSWLISPKKKPPKPNARKCTPSQMQEGGGDGKDQLELLFAHAEATLGELLVKAGTSFHTKSTLQEDYHPQPHLSSRTNGSLDSTSVRLGGSFGRSGAVAGQGHARRNSLSRVWHQLGGSLFCGSGHKNAFLMEEMELRGLAPMPQTSSATYFEDGADEGMAADESYWQSLAESILMQRQKTTDAESLPIHHLDEQNELSVRDNMVETSHGFSVTSVSASQLIGIENKEPESECRVSEIMLVCGDDDVLGTQEDECRWAACGIKECSSDDSHNELHVPVERGHGCTRLNTTLESSPILAHNYQLHMKSREDCGDATSRSSSSNVVEPANNYSRPLSLSVPNQVVKPMLAHTAASSSSAVCGSSSNGEATAQPFEDFLAHALGRWPEPNESNSESSANAIATGATMMPTDPGAQKQPELATNSARVSLMALLHEEAAAVESMDVHNAIEEVSQAQAVVPREEEGLVGEEPLALFCCVCMVRRKGAALIPCGHTFCRICSKQLFAGRGACPLCNNLIVQLLDIF